MRLLGLHDCNTITYAYNTIIMESLLSNLRIHVNQNLYLTDPLSSKLGRNILLHAVEMIDRLGFESFTFKKLGDAIGSPEASVYRYFKNKNQLLTYIISWYWGWMEYHQAFETANIHSAELRLEKSIALIANNRLQNFSMEVLDLEKLHRIVISESSKSYLTKDVDKANKEGAFENYKHFVSRMALIIKEIAPEYKYPHMLVSTIIEGAHLQVFFADHLPGLTNKQRSSDYITKFYTELALNSLKNTI